METVFLSLSPQQILENPLYNKGTAFTKEERDELGLNGYLPYHISTLEEQVARRYHNFQSKSTPLAKYSFLSNLQNRNEILFYRLASEHITEMLPLIYTPTVGDVSLQFSTLYRQHRGTYFSYPLRDQIEAIVANIPNEDVDVIVITDGERILGLGDVGIGGMAIPQGKLALYTLFGGIHPSKVLPIQIDVGTNNPELLKDPLYLGWQHPRVTGEEYYRFIEAIVTAIQKRFPKVLLQWEDFAKQHARPLLETYRKKICSFNDDIQGTAAVALSALLSAVKQNKQQLKDQRIAVFGGGSAGLGISHLIMEAMLREGCTEREARQRFYIIDIDGLIHDGLDKIDPEQRPYAHNYQTIKDWSTPGTHHISLESVVKNARPSILIGVSAMPGAFTEAIVRAMGEYEARPIILPLSNPTSRCEAQPKDLLTWTEGRAIIATGSPFPPVELQGKKHPIAQCNNVFIFPGVGLGIVASKSPEVTDTMFIRAAEVLSNHAPILKDPTQGIFPALEGLRSISKEIALAVWEVAIEEGLVTKTPRSKMEQQIDQITWSPDYPIYRKSASKARS